MVGGNMEQTDPRLADVDTRAREQMEQDRRRRIVELGQIFTGLAAFVWAVKVLTGER